MTDVESSAKTFNMPSTGIPLMVKVSVKATTVPSAGETKSAAFGSPDWTKDTQEEPGRGPAQAGFFGMFIVGKPELFAVSVALLKSASESALLQMAKAESAPAITAYLMK